MKDLKSKPDSRDRVYARSNKTIRPHVDLREFASPVDSQLSIGSCAADALVNAYELMVKMATPNSYTDLSRLFVYYNGRLLEGVEEQDAGIFLRDGLKSLARYGVCTEKLWPYDVKKFNVQPPPQAYEDALQRRITNYRLLPNITDVIDALNNDRPVVIGLRVHESFVKLNETNSVYSGPISETDRPGDSHALCLVGYDIPKQVFIAKNSFGSDWGDAGYCYISFDWLRDGGLDMWTFDIRTPETLQPSAPIPIVLPAKPSMQIGPRFVFMLRHKMNHNSCQF